MPNSPANRSVSFMPAPLTSSLKTALPPPPLSSTNYFITLCTHERQCLFGEIIEGQMQLNALGSIVADEWQNAVQNKPQLICDQWIIMPNHIHGIVTLAESLAETSSEPTSSELMEPLPEPTEPTLADWIDGFKAAVTKRFKSRRPIWQPVDDQQLISDPFTFNTFRQYIRSNPHAWLWDKLHPDSPSEYITQS
jgi:putative transposase